MLYISAGSVLIQLHVTQAHFLVFPHSENGKRLNIDGREEDGRPCLFLEKHLPSCEQSERTATLAW